MRGKVKVQSTLRLERRDHPRVCGEKGRKMKQQFIGLGSPPRMRGKGSDGRGAGDVEGITPAYAGKSCRRCPQRSRSRDHPRVCGEKYTRAALCACILRITPAYAGKSIFSFFGFVHVRDHPRVCGEKFTVNTVDLDLIGSPPRMRGKACAASGRACAAGITPAYAGKRYKVLPDTCGTGDYPRVCGEKYDAPP